MLLRQAILKKTRDHIRPLRTYWVDIHTVTTDEAPLNRMDCVAGMLLVGPRDSRLEATLVALQPEDHPDAGVGASAGTPVAEVTIPLKRVSGRGTDDMFIWDREGPTQFLRGGMNVRLRFTQASPGTTLTVVMYGAYDESAAADDALPLTLTLEEDLVPEPGPGVFVADLVPWVQPPRNSAVAFARWREEDTSHDTRLRIGRFGFAVDEWTTLAVRLGAFGLWDPATKTCTLAVGTPTPIRHIDGVRFEIAKGTCGKRKRARRPLAVADP
jgi:hypothetical protein